MSYTKFSREHKLVWRYLSYGFFLDTKKNNINLSKLLPSIGI